MSSETGGRMRGEAGLRARNVRVRLVSANTAANLETALQAFLAGLTEEILLSIDYQKQPGEYTALVLFTR